MDQNQLESMAMQFVQAYYGALSTNVESIQNFYVGETGGTHLLRPVDARRDVGGARGEARRGTRPYPRRGADELTTVGTFRIRPRSSSPAAARPIDAHF